MMRLTASFLLIAPAYPLLFDIEANEFGVHSVSATLFRAFKGHGNAATKRHHRTEGSSNSRA
jgi:hypothetical protein